MDSQFYQSLAQQRGGNYRETDRWTCKLGHQFTLATDRVLAGSWCTVCRTPKLSTAKNNLIIEALKLGRQHHGFFIDQEPDFRLKVKWSCLGGHQLLLSLKQVRDGS